MAGKREKPEDIVSKLRQVEVLQGQGATIAEAICEAVTRPTMRFVAVKSKEQQALLSIHRVRQLIVRQKTQMLSVICGLL